MKRILVADDRASSRELVREILEASGYQVVEAADGSKAVEVASQAQPDLILLDLQMPVLDGYGALAQLREDHRLHRIPVIALTANAMQRDRERTLAAGFDSYLAKPVSLDQLLQEVERLLA